MSNHSKRIIKHPEGLEKAIEAVEEKLDVEDYIFEHIDLIYHKLEQCDLRAKKAENDGNQRYQCDMMFIAESLPVISAIIQVGSKLENYNSAKKWVRDELPDADAVSVLSALTFLYIVGMGQGEHENSTYVIEYPGLGKVNKRDIWNRISERVNRRFLSLGESANAAPIQSPEPLDKLSNGTESKSQFNIHESYAAVVSDASTKI
ncbi:hypothetical protein [Microseira wollei]|uniref:Uncharacterized protein n=1 Tax=Microseira wollei NIES-4236 TaxID=2530354 RepID=A0AAV3X900_9CYAN|nr:hypothetical protein [Microseira wollei]GET36550.1 hypothetical protein MiSe_13010 [Microseira wollei NIES-4236]